MPIATTSVKEADHVIYQAVKIEEPMTNEDVLSGNHFE